MNIRHLLSSECWQEWKEENLGGKRKKYKASGQSWVNWNVISRGVT